MKKFMSALLSTFLCLSAFSVPVIAEEETAVSDQTEITEEILK